MALPAAQFDLLKARLEPWLAHVFQVMGGYVLATGVLTITLATTSFRAHRSGCGFRGTDRRGRVHRLDGGRQLRH